MANGINANLLRRWVREAETGGAASKPSNATGAQARGAHGERGLRADAAARPRRCPRHPHRTAPRRDLHHHELAQRGGRFLRSLDARAAAMIRIDAMWLCVEPLDMRAGADRLMARVVEVFGAAQAHHGYLFGNARGTRIKLLVHDGLGVWCATRRLNQGRFVWPAATAGACPRSPGCSSTPSWWACPGSAWNTCSSSPTCDPEPCARADQWPRVRAIRRCPNDGTAGQLQTMAAHARCHRTQDRRPQGLSKGAVTELAASCWHSCRPSKPRSRPRTNISPGVIARSSSRTPRSSASRSSWRG
jgi:transposase